MLSVWAAVAQAFRTRISNPSGSRGAEHELLGNYLPDQLLKNRDLWNTKRVQKTSSSVKIGMVCCALCMHQNEIIVTAW